MASTKSTSKTTKTAKTTKKTLAKARPAASKSKPIAKAAARSSGRPGAKLTTKAARADARSNKSVAGGDVKSATNKSGTNKSGAGAAKSPGGNLDAIARALITNDVSAALATALETWRAGRAPALADLIDTISKKIATQPIANDLEWTKAAATRDPAALGRLLSVIRELPVSFLPTVAQHLGRFPDDPRLGTAAAEWIVDPPTQSSSTYPFWTQLYNLLVRTGDTRVIAAIEERVALPMEASKQFPKDKIKKPSQFWGKFYTALEKTRDQLVALPTATVDKEAIAKLAKLAGKLPIIQVAATTPGKVTVAGGNNSRVETGPPLVRALAHATASRTPDAIAALLDAWRDKRAPELADLIDRATRLLPTHRETLPVEAKSAHAAWQAAFDRDPIGELPRLVRHIHVGGAAAATEHVVALSTLPDDPRIAHRLAELACTINISPERGQYWKSTWELIARTRDTRVIAPLRQDFNDFSGTYYDHHRSGRRIVGDFVLGEPLASTLDAADHTLVNKISSCLDRIVPDHIERERALLADICANWNDEAPRLVYADWLIERENLRGHMIVLSCKKARETALSKNEGKQLTALRGAFRAPTYLFGVLSDFGIVLDRGLPSQIKVTWNSSPISWSHLAGDPLLPCIEVIAFDTHDLRGRPSPEDLARVMLDPTASRLVRVDQVPNELGNPAPRVELHETSRLADALEPLVKSQWKRDGRNFLRK